MSAFLTRRQFLGTAAAAGAALTLAPRSAFGANDRLVVGVMGLGGRGTGLAKTFAQQPNTEVAYVCDVDTTRAGKAGDEVGKVAKAPKTVQDFRRILDDKAVDVLVVATCNHWHAPAAILGCAAGKHVYVEKPCSHNPREGELMVEVAHKHNRRVQMGNQRRSWPVVIEAIEQLRSGIIGRAYYAEAWYTNNRPTIGKGKEAKVPEGLDYDLWQGPAPKKAFHDNYLHYNWHWFWHWGNGELGNNGVHTIDVCRWGLGVDFPLTVESTGGRYRYEDDQETPDTNLVTYTFEGRKAIHWNGLSCNRLPEGKSQDILFHGEKGSLAINGSGYAIYDEKGREVKKAGGNGGDVVHIANFLDAIRGGKALNSEIEEGHKSTLLCHLGNIAYRTGRSLRCDAKTGRILGDKEAAALWGREYDRTWQERLEAATEKKLS
jgi:predicted dehydrogenase